MKYIQNIDQAASVKQKPYYTIVKPEEAFGLLKWKIRIIKAWAVLRGKANAFTYTKN